MKKLLRIFLLVLLGVVLIGTFVFLWKKTSPKKEVYAIVTPVQDTIRQYVIATGKVQPRDEVLIKPQISGIISEVRVEAGDHIKVGDVIATVKVVPELGSLNSAELRMNTTVLSLEQTRKEHARTKALYEKGVVSEEEFEKSATLLGTAEDEAQSARDSYQIVKNGISSRYQALSSTQIRSTITGMVLDVPIKVGNSVIQSNSFNDGTTIASIADMSDMLFVGNVDETDVGKLVSDMPVQLTIGAMQQVTLDAKLEYISPKAIDVNGVIMFEVKAAVTIPSTVFVRAGYSANASIIIQSRDGVMTLPENAIQFEEGKPCVYVLTSPEGASNQTFEKRDVAVGLSDGMKIEIVSGLSETDKVRGLQIQNN